MPAKPRIDTEGQAGYAENKVEGEGIDRDTYTDSRGAESPAEPTALQIEGVQQSESAEAGQGAGVKNTASGAWAGTAIGGAFADIGAAPGALIGGISGGLAGRWAGETAGDYLYDGKKD